MTELLVICGMHRSGTSLVAHLLRELGWDLGPEADLMPPKADNPRGFAEHLPAVRLNDRLLYRLGGTWSAPPALPAGWATRRDLDDLRAQAEQVVTQLSARPAGRVLLKDPRFSLTLPFWQTVTEVQRTLLVLRAPDEVVASLLRRDDALDEAGAATLWIRYTLAALRHTNTLVVTSTARLLEDLPTRLRQLSEQLGHLPGDHEVAAANAVVEERLWGRSGRERPPGDAPPSAALHRARLLHAVLTSEDSTQWRSALSGLTTVEEVTAAARPSHAAIDTERIQHARLRDRVPRLEEQLQRARDDVDRLRDERDRARARAEGLARRSVPDHAAPVESGADEPAGHDGDGEAGR